MNKKIKYVNIPQQWQQEKKKLLPVVEKVLSSGNYILGKPVEKFENNIKKICKSKYCVSLNSGTDALVCGLIALGVKRGDEVITPPNSFIASTAAIVHIGAIPVFADVLDDQNIDPRKIEKAITKKTRAIMPVHLTGRMAKMNKIKKIAKKHKIKIIEDAAQSIGSKYLNKLSGTWGDVGCFSAHPLKNLNACGDGGFLITNDKKIYEKVKLMRNHGIVGRTKVNQFGYVSRMDSIQAAILNFRLAKLKKVINARRLNAKLYLRYLNQKNVFIPKEEKNEYNTYHTFVIQTPKRDKLKKYLLSKGIETAIHYSIPIHKQPAYLKLKFKKKKFKVAEAQSKKILTLPINQSLNKRHIKHIAETINKFFNDSRN